MFRIYSIMLFNFFPYYFRLELNGHRRRLTWEATPRSIHEGRKYLFNFQSKPLKKSVLPLITFNFLKIFFCRCFISHNEFWLPCLWHNNSTAFCRQRKSRYQRHYFNVLNNVEHFFSLRFGFTLYSFDINWLIISDLVIWKQERDYLLIQNFFLTLTACVNSNSSRVVSEEGFG